MIPSILDDTLGGMDNNAKNKMKSWLLSYIHIYQ